MTAPKWYDFIQKRAEITLPLLIEAFGQLHTNRFVIGEETGLGGYEHYQCRLQFSKPYTLNELIEFNRRFGITGEWRPSHIKNFDYCEKEGKFYRSWEGALAKFHDLELRNWQRLAIGDLGEQSEREITCIVDYTGNNGKTYLGKYCEVNHIADYCPVNSGESGEYVAYCLGYKAKGYIFDIPRCDTIKDKKQMWKAIEQIKNGCLYDGRYAPRKEWIDPPKILVFANEDPPVEYLSMDRWRVYYIVGDDLSRIPTENLTA